MKRIFLYLCLIFSIHTNAQQIVSVYFDFNAHRLTTDAVSILDQFVKDYAHNNPPLRFRIEGHCDAIGNDAYNDRLSVQRVNAVKSYLLKHGFDQSNILVDTGYGKRKPVNTNSTEEERQRNRRVQISFSIFESVPDSSKSLIKKLTDTTTSTGNIILQDINFYGGRHQFLPSSKPMLQELLDALKTYPKLVIRIEGHICCEKGPGDGVDNDTGENNLSEARAKAIMDYLIQNGISASRLSYKGFGHSRPIHPYPEKNEMEQIENRRVEIKIISR